MTDGPSQPDSSAQAHARDIDRACGDVKRELADGREPRIGDFLDRVRHLARAAFLRIRLATELKHKAEHRLPMNLDDNRVRFPDDGPIVEEALSQAGELHPRTVAMASEFDAVPYTDTVLQSPGHDAPEDWLPAIPGYSVEKRIGSGGMGVVFVASRPGSELRYAIKMLLQGRTASFSELARFRVEAEAYACLDHPNIIKIRDVGVAYGCPFLAMDFASNGSLQSYLTSTTDRDIDWVIHTIQQVAEGIMHAHARFMIHRDLKPANILIMDDGTPRVSDFGLVKFSSPPSFYEYSETISISELNEYLVHLARENSILLPVDENQDPDTILAQLTDRCAERSGLSALSFEGGEIRHFLSRVTEKYCASDLKLLNSVWKTRKGAVVGSPQFMSPEQALGQIECIGPHTDVYGLGATLYAAVTGQPPISLGNHRDPFDVIRRVPSEVPPMPAALNRSISDDLSAVIMKAIHKDYRQRYPRMELLSEDLLRVRSGRATLARLEGRHHCLQG